MRMRSHAGTGSRTLPIRFATAAGFNMLWRGWELYNFEDGVVPLGGSIMKEKLGLVVREDFQEGRSACEHDQHMSG